MRKKTKVVQLGKVRIGGNNPISVQSMTTFDPIYVEDTVKQIKELEKAGCDFVRVAVPTMESAYQLANIKSQISIPLVADIHFNYKLALEAIKQNVDALRLNPGNIGNDNKVKEIVVAAKEKNIPIRVGVNAGSLEKQLLEKYGGPTAEAMVESAIRQVSILEDLNYDKILISLKASDIKLTVDACEIISNEVDYPLHIGVTEAGTTWSGTIKSAIGIGHLLLQGIGDTIRVSLTGNPVEEIKVGRQILKSLDIIRDEITIISCPTCGRCIVDLISLANEANERFRDIKKPIKVAIMGCSVNGPGEAKDADIGIAGGASGFILFKNGKLIKKVKKNEALNVLLYEIEKM
ncbi:MAG: flavodoxin-dependent (E)-4-hydroxy-3-methylbut-2-enyl-diphosphate synthase [Clostridiales bacterium]|nr:flavodoxin-dependent (E)-4-hydroxy-3-methylbut-2-enyl-diphosphate synthase [Clostridiales bacterium]